MHHELRGAPIRAGASLAGRVIEAMTARVQYVQADQIASAVAAVGNVAKVSGTAVVTRNGVPVELKQGDRLLKGDVVQTGPDTTIGISFVDGTALGLASNARIVLDEMTYDSLTKPLMFQALFLFIISYSLRALKNFFPEPKVALTK